MIGLRFHQHDVNDCNTQRRQIKMVRDAKASRALWYDDVRDVSGPTYIHFFVFFYYYVLTLCITDYSVQQARDVYYAYMSRVPCSILFFLSFF
jgi:hypothetical protein